MDENHMNGKIEAAGRILLNLIAVLEDQGVLDGEAFTARLRNTAAALDFDQPYLPDAKFAIMTAANDLDDAREHRKWVAQGEAPTHPEQE